MSVRDQLGRLRGTATGAQKPASGGGTPDVADSADTEQASAADVADEVGARPVAAPTYPGGGSASCATGATHGPETLLPGAEETTPFGACYVVEWHYPLAHAHGVAPLGATITAPIALGNRLLARSAAEREHLRHADVRRFVYLDTETTGLAGGTGTYAFLIGIGRFTDADFVVRQIFMRTLAEEHAALHVLQQAMVDCHALVTYNGKAFDWPLIETRYALARRGGPRAPRTPGAHVDLLFAARRLWRARLESCTLGRVEEALLGVRRREDTPGWLIPQLYFAYLRDHDTRPLVGVFRHNALDLLSLAALLGRVASVEGAMPRPTTRRGCIAVDLDDVCQVDGAPANVAEMRRHGATAPADARENVPADEILAVGRCREEDSDLEGALACYEAAARGDALAGALRAAVMREARLRAGLVLKRLRRADDAVRFWEAAVADSLASGDCDVRPYEELAKYYEHMLRDAASAREYVVRALRALDATAMCGPSQHRARLHYRLQRLDRLLAVSARHGASN